MDSFLSKHKVRYPLEDGNFFQPLTLICIQLTGSKYLRVYGRLIVRIQLMVVKKYHIF